MENELFSRCDLAEKIGVAEKTIRRWVAAGEFPAPISVVGRRFWVGAEIDSWIEERIAERDAVTA